MPISAPCRMLEVDGLTVRYGRVVALHELSLHIDDGEFVSIVGPNGAGKSSLLAAIAGRVPAAGGTIRLAGETVTGARPEQLAARGLGFVPEGRHIFATLTVAENLKLGAMVARGGLDDPYAAEVLARFPVLERYLGAPAGRLSGGEQQQLAVARALLARPKLLMLDEPSLGLAPRLVDEVFRILVELHAAGTQILLVEQNATRAVAIADRSYVLKVGRVVLEGTRVELVGASASMTSAYLGS